ncbi:MAG: hypothetical protein ABSA21_05805 [Candidatus Limnocylindrales bacterium]
MRWPFSLPRRSQGPTLSADGSHAPAAPAEEPPEPRGTGLEALPRTLGSAPLTQRAGEFISSLALSHGLTPTLRPLGHATAAGGPTGLIRDLAMPVAAPAAGGPAARSTLARSTPSPAGQTGGDTEPAAARGQSPGATAESSVAGTAAAGTLPGPVGGLAVGKDLVPTRRLPAVDPAAAEQRRSYARVDPASDPGGGAGRMPWSSAGQGEALATQAVHGQVGLPASAGSTATDAARADAGLSPGGGQAQLSPGRIRRVGLGAPLAGLPGSAQHRGLGPIQPFPGAAPEGTWGSVPPGAAAEQAGRRPPIRGGAPQALPVLPVLPVASSPASLASSGLDRGSDAARESRTTPFAPPGPALGSPNGARPGTARTAPAATGNPGGPRSMSVQRAVAGRGPDALGHPVAGSDAPSAGYPPVQARPVWSQGPARAGASHAQSVDAGQSELPLAGPPSSPAASPTSTVSAVSPAQPVIQRIHSPHADEPDTAGGGDVVVARAAGSSGAGGGSQGPGAAAGAQTMPDDQVEQLAGRVYWRIRDRLGAELLRDRERVGLLPDR